MEQLTGRLKAVTHREIAVVFVCALGAYLLRVRQSYDLKPAWRLDVELDHYHNRRYAQEWEKIPPPIITDIESDGQNEVVMATHHGNLQILRVPMKQPGSLILPYIELLNEVSLISGDNDSGTRRHPVAMATGYLDAYQSMIQVRQQVIIVLTSDWTVLCFDHQLQLLWETQLMNIQQDRYYIRDVAMTVVSHKLKSDDRGVIIIGASIGDKFHRVTTLKHEHKKKQEVKDPLKDDFDDLVDEDEEPPVDVNHFSTFALNGQDGSIRWHHLPGDFNEQRTMDQEMFKAHHFKLALRKGLRHEGELTWNHYTQAVLANLPHRWQGRQDTKVSLARFIRDKTTKDDNEETATMATIIGLEDHHLAGYQYGGLRPHHPSEHLHNPNAIVSHMHEGIEVLDLSTGRPLTRIKLTHDRSTYADVNDDGIIDQVKGHFTENADDDDNCVAVVRSGIPPSLQLFNGSICHIPRLLDMLYLAGSLFGSTNMIENQRLTVPPITVKSVAQKRGILNHLLGLNHLRWVRQGMDSVFLVSNGRVTSYGPMGHFNWQVDTSAKWSDTVTVFNSKHYFAPELIDVYNNAFVPSMQPTSLQVFGKEDAALVVGWNSMVLISLVDGRWLAEHSLPCRPDAPVVIGDLDGDGYNDYIVQCPNGLVGFHMQQFSGYWSTALICICLLVAVVGLTSLCTSGEYIFDEHDHDER
ncbi:uncharacterized protein [Amphiura filiformis]|uniref:uncharacterized protein n=1 Tax=Amphiura filiformis TaxID=82378 RepID=UPI003B218944